MTETWGVPGERVIAEGRLAVISKLENLGEPDFAIDTGLALLPPAAAGPAPRRDSAAARRKARRKAERQARRRNR